MSLIAKASGDRVSEPAPEGEHIARCIAVVDLGTQHSELYNKESHKVRFTWELPACKKVFKEENGPEPFIISRKFTLSMHKQSALLPFLERWRGRKFTKEELEGFDLKKLLSAPARLLIIHDTKDDGAVRASVDTALPCKPQDCPPQILKSVYYEVEMGRNDVFKSLPQFLQEDISKCNEFRNPPPHEEDTMPACSDEQEVPF